MKVRKPRTAKERPWNKWLERNKGRTECLCFDGFTSEGHPMTECNAPWSDKCDGNVFKCAKLKYHHLASINKK